MCIRDSIDTAALAATQAAVSMLGHGLRDGATQTESGPGDHDHFALQCHVRLFGLVVDRFEHGAHRFVVIVQAFDHLLWGGRVL